MSSRPTPEPQLDPFTPIETVPTSPLGGGAPTAHRVYLTGVPDGRGWRLVGTIPAQKLLLSNQEIQAMAQEITGKSPWDWAPKTTFFDGRHLAYSLVTEDCSADVDAENPLSLGLLFQNSYDGSWEPGMRLFAHRQVPATGLLHAQHFGELCFLCGPSNGGWSAERRRVEQYMETAGSKLEQFSRRCRGLQREPVGASDLAGLRRRPLTQLPRRLWSRLVDRYLHSPDLTAWGLLTSGAVLLWTESGPSRPEIFHYNQLLTEAVVGRISTEDTIRW
ncbi:hypothetical protein GGQ18_001803 [Salinibacter ruber]|uniref:hypothetical protein n=1 Tax=Salinibacter ruber TaxID=146919 RepID=UPI001622AADC|nr:hypothetical protein [Salinibacter ruber]MBB4069219.1 hypothetical protein [Salinibacter ruber]